MKRILLILLSCIVNITFAQNNIILQQNNSSSSVTSNDSGEYFINGISTKQDIGGVDVQFIAYRNGFYGENQLKFTNYNNFTVSVIFEVMVDLYPTGTRDEWKKTTGAITLKANEVKIAPNIYETVDNHHCVMIVRRIGPSANVTVQSSISNSEYVDLGLPSGTLWKTKNEKGVYYAYDEAITLFGNQLPSKDHFLELRDCCEWTWNGNGYLITGANGNSIILHTTNTFKYTGTKVGQYWTSTLSNIEQCGYGVTTASNEMFWLGDNFSVKAGESPRLSVRLIK